MPDISMCKGDGCPLKADCYRFTAMPDEYRQTYFMTPPIKDGECSYSWPLPHERDGVCNCDACKRATEAP